MNSEAGFWWGLVVATLSGSVLAADPVRDADAEMFPAGVAYDAAIPTPEAFLGRPLGAAPVRHHELVDYITTIANMSDRLKLEIAGYTHERRPILFIIATSPGNHARLDEIRTQHNALTEPASGQEVSDSMPVVTWLNYGVHGAEASGMDASLPIVYHLAAAQGTRIENELANSVVLVTAVFNPDGHAQRVAWLDAYGSQVPNADPQHAEHDMHWQFARTNHYWFDLNRQWISVTQPESRAWMSKWYAWRPNVSVDFHEMGPNSTYYFHPGVPARTNPIIPAAAESLTAASVRFSEEFLDAEGKLYYHAEGFDTYFLGKGSGLPFVNGGIGILYEAAAARGIELQTPLGLRTYRENIRKHFRASLGMIRGALALRQQLLDYQKDFYDSALTEAAGDTVKAYVFATPGDDSRMYHFLDLLTWHRIQVYDLARDITVNGRAFAAGEAKIVPMGQPQYRMIRVIFERFTEFADPTFYDVSTWTYPLAYDLDYEALSGRNFQESLLAEQSAVAMPAAAAPDGPDYAYAFAWSDYYAPRALNRVLSAGLMARGALQPFSVRTSQGDMSFDRGTIVVPFDRQEKNPDEIKAIMESVAANDGVTVHSLTSGQSTIGTAGVNVGGRSFAELQQVKVLLIIGRDTDLYNAGEIWHLLDYRMQMAVSLHDRDRLDGIDWKQYTHLVFPGGEYENYMPDYVDRIRQWVAEGGTIIGIRQGAYWVRDNVLDYVEPVEGEALVPDEDLETGTGHDDLLDEEAIETERYDYADKQDIEAADLIRGAIFSGDLDITHPLGFGYSDRNIALHKNLSDIMERPVNPFATVISYQTPPVLSGFASQENQAAIEGTAALIAERKGSGSVILFADDPNFRATWFGTNKLFLNALFYSKAFQAPAE
ncbi:MAG: peptidase [Gammaproteobacteria bacterium]|nr:MAG: peptidase [Gammaproteobacteria bacterium]